MACKISKPLDIGGALIDVGGDIGCCLNVGGCIMVLCFGQL